MKKLIIIPLIILLLLTACQLVMVDNADPTESTTPSGSITSTTDSEVSTTQSTGPTTTLPADISDGHAFIFQGHQPTIRFEVDLSKLVEGHLYYIDLSTQEITPICDEAVIALAEDDFDTDFVYYVKASEPTKVYRTKQNDPKVHTVVYESTFGPVNDITSSDYSITKQEVLQFVADNKYFVVLELETGETTLVMEQYYLRSAFFEYGIHETWDEHNYVFFGGKLSEGEKIKNYLYSRDTGTVDVEEDE